MALIEDTEDSMLRSDLWHTMSLAELAAQQEILIRRVGAITNFIAAGSPTQGMLAMYHALQLGLADLNNILNNKASQEK